MAALSLQRALAAHPADIRQKHLCVFVRSLASVYSANTYVLYQRLLGLDRKYKGATALMVPLHTETNSSGCSQRWLVAP